MDRLPLQLNDFRYSSKLYAAYVGQSVCYRRKLGGKYFRVYLRNAKVNAIGPDLVLIY